MLTFARATRDPATLGRKGGYSYVFFTLGKPVPFTVKGCQKPTHRLQVQPHITPPNSTQYWQYNPTLPYRCRWSKKRLYHLDVQAPPNPLRGRERHGDTSRHEPERIPASFHMICFANQNNRSDWSRSDRNIQATTTSQKCEAVPRRARIQGS